MTDYFYDMDLVLDPLNPSNVVANGQVAIYDPADTAGTTLLALKDPSGLPLPNPLTSNANGFLPPRIAQVPQTMWKSGGFEGYFNSYKGLRDEAVQAVTAAQAAANTAATAAADRVTTAAVQSGKLILTKADGTAIDTGSVLGPTGPKGDKGVDGANVLPTDDAIEAAITGAGTKTKAALSATYEPKGAGTAAAAPVVPLALAPRERAKRTTGQTVATAMQPGHGWSITSGTAAASNMNDTTDYTLGSQSATLTTTNLAATVQLGSANPVASPVNATGKALRVWVKVSDPTKLSEFSFWAASGGSYNTCYRWDVISYGGGIDFIQPNQWTPLTLHFGNAGVTGVPDRAALNRFKFQIKDRATGAVTVGFNGLETIPDAGATYPNGVISLTFDDTWLSQYTHAKPIMDKYGYQGTAYIITGNVGTANRMSLAQLKQLQLQGWEIATHAATQAIHDGNYGALSAEMITAELQAAKTWLAANGFRGGDHFAYPGGHCENNAGPTAQLYFTSARLVYGQNAETLPPADPNRIRSMQPSSGTSVASINAQIDAVVASKAWLPLSFHDFVTAGATGVAYNTGDFDTILAYAQSKGVAVRTIGQALRGE